MAPLSRVKVSQLNLIDLVTKVIDLGVDLSAITYTVEDEVLYLQTHAPDGAWFYRVDGNRHNLIVSDGLKMTEYICYHGTQPHVAGTNSIFDSTTDGRIVGSPVQDDEDDEDDEMQIMQGVILTTTEQSR
jgi:hypothetical protein